MQTTSRKDGGFLACVMYALNQQPMFGALFLIDKIEGGRN